MFAYELRVYDNVNEDENEDEDENSYLEAIHHPSSLIPQPSSINQPSPSPVPVVCGKQCIVLAGNLRACI